MLLKFKQPIVIITITLFSLLNVQAQKGLDLTSVNYTDITNEQLQLLFQEATAEIAQIEDEMQMKYELPPSFMVG